MSDMRANQHFYALDIDMGSSRIAWRARAKTKIKIESAFYYDAEGIIDACYLM